MSNSDAHLDAGRAPAEASAPAPSGAAGPETAAAAPPPADPTGSRIFHHRPTGRDGVGAWIALPARPGRDGTPLVAVHGILRQARAQAEGFAARASALGRTVIAPDYDAKRWPRYQQAVRRGRADLALLRLLDDLALSGLVPGGRVDLFGYSGGGQFAHRFAMLYPNAVRRLTLAAAGWFTFPDAAPFPYGLGGDEAWGRRMRDRLPETLALPITVCVGERDREPDANTRRGPEIDAQQGTNRYDRARRWVGAMQMAAERHGIGRAHIRLELLPRTGHDFTQCLRRGGLARIALPDPTDGLAPAGTDLHSV